MSGWLDALDEEVADDDDDAQMADAQPPATEQAGGSHGSRGPVISSSRTQASQSHPPTCPLRGRGRGRPHGSRLFHEKRKAAEEEQRATQQGTDLVETPLEKARRVLKEKRLQESKTKPDRRPAVADGRLQRFGEITHMGAVGSMVQRNLLSVAAESRVGQEGESGGDNILQAHLRGQLLTTPWKALSNIFSESASVVASKARSAGAAVVELGSWLWSAMCTSLQPLYDSEIQAPGSRPRLRPMLYVMRLRYDETPSKVRVVTGEQHGTVVLPNQPSRAEAARGELATNAEVLATLQEARKRSGGNQPLHGGDLVEMSTQSKIIQSEYCTGMLFKDYLSGQYFWVWGELPTWLMAVGRCTGENTRRCIMDVVEAAPEMRRVWSPFEMKLRVSITDRFGANGRAEAGLTEEGFLPEFPFCHVACDVHRLSTATGNATMLMSEDVSGVLNTGLACGSLGTTRRLREILAQILEQDLEVEFGAPPTGPVAEHASAMLDLLLPSDAPSRAQRKQNCLRKFILRRFLILGFNPMNNTFLLLVGCPVAPQVTISVVVAIAE